jgi:membrane protease YdiL (CAAX protease family)
VSTCGDQHGLIRSVVLHLLPGAVLFGCVVGAAAVGIEPVVALLFGIGLVIAPLELGYLFIQGKRRNGRWSLAGIVDYDQRFSARQIARWTAPLVLWWIVILAISIAFLDSWLADTVFAWYPESIRDMATLDATGDTPATGVLVIVFAAALALNGVLGPVAEELYFRGHLLPRIDRFGRAAPVLNTVLFSLYHFWSPWQNLARIIGLLPWIYVVWRKRSVQLSIAVHVTANTIFLLLLVPAFL